MSLLKIKYKKDKDNKKDLKESYKLINKIKTIMSDLRSLDDKKGYNTLCNLIKDHRFKFQKPKTRTVTVYRDDLRAFGVIESVFKINNSFNTNEELKAAKDNVNSIIRDRRKERKNIKIFEQTFSYAGESFCYPKLGIGEIKRKNESGEEETISLNIGVYTKPGTFIEVFKYKQVKGIFEAKGPLDNSNHVGIELEFFCNMDQKKLAYELFETGYSKHLCLATDGSIRPESDMTGHELKICCPENMVDTIISKVYEVLQRVGAKVNQSCGTHVHVDMRNRDKNIVFKNLVRAQKILYKMDPERKTNKFAKPTESTNIEEVLQTGNGGRYWGINPKALDRHSTLEIRIHSGMIESSMITNWTNLLVCIASLEEAPSEFRTTEGFFKKYKIPVELQTYVNDRIAIHSNIEQAA